MKRKIYFLMFALCFCAAANWVHAINVSPSEIANVPAGGENRTFTLTASVNNETWTITPQVDWITVSETSGTLPMNTSKQITVTVKPNSSTSAREGLIFVWGSSSSTGVTVKQEGIPSLTVSPTTLNFKSSAGSQKFNVTSNGYLDLRSNDPTWLTVSPMTSTGSGAATATVIANPLTSERIGTITITRGTLKQTVTVIQAGVPFLTVTTNTLEFASSSSMIPFGIQSNTDWTITNNSGGWVSVSSSGGNDNATINVTVSANTSSTSRTATITVTAGTLTRIITVNQAAYVPSLTVSPASPEFTVSGGSKTITVNSNTDWTITKNIAAWCTVSSSGGSGNATLNITVTANTLATQRVGYLYFDAAGVPRQTVTVTQDAAPTGAPPEITSHPQSKTVDEGESTGFGVVATGTAPLTYQWQFSSNGGATWTNTGTNSASINVAAEAELNGCQYRCIVSHVIGGVTYSATSNAATLTVTSTTVAPTITSANSYTCAAGTGGSLALTATGTTPITWSVTGAPAGVTVSGSTLNVAATVAAGTHNFTITAANGTSPNATQAFTLTVTASTVAVTGVSLNKSAATLTVGATETLTATIAPSTATNKNVTWTTDNAAVATVAAGVVTAVSAGTAIITVTTQDGGHTATCNVTVDAPAGPVPFMTLSLTSLSYDASGGEQTFTITTNTDWLITCPASWVTVTPLSGANTATVTVTVPANTTGAPRPTTLTVSGTDVSPQSVSVTQSNTSVANETVAPTSPTAYARDGILHISGLTVGESWRVYNILGVLIASPTPSEGEEFAIPLPGKGVYIITNGKTALKVSH